jgi:hypothetical protein
MCHIRHIRQEECGVTRVTRVTRKGVFFHFLGVAVAPNGRFAPTAASVKPGIFDGNQEHEAAASAARSCKAMWLGPRIG